MHPPRQNRNLKIVREHKKVEANAFYQQNEIQTVRRRPAGDKKNKLNFKLKRPDGGKQKGQSFNQFAILSNFKMTLNLLGVLKSLSGNSLFEQS